MKRLLALASLALLAACADAKSDPRTFDNNDLELAVGNSARFGCTCRFVMNMPEDYCRAWVKASPDVASVSWDLGAKTADASSFLSFAAHARYVDARRGCVLQ
jgi:hypothetical protein